jgi:peptide methionine sulfoxide reductase MsrB
MFAYPPYESPVLELKEEYSSGCGNPVYYKTEQYVNTKLLQVMSYMVIRTEVIIPYF